MAHCGPFFSRSPTSLLLFLGDVLFGGFGLGLGYISAVSILIKWFPDRPGLSTGLAIMGFGGGAMTGGPLANNLITFFKSQGQTEVIPTTFMVVGCFVFRFYDVRRFYDPSAYARLETRWLCAGAKNLSDDSDI